MLMKMRFMGTPPWFPLNQFRVISILFNVWKVIRVSREYLFDSGEGDQFQKEVGIYSMLGRWRALPDETGHYREETLSFP
jgi:hypothetical protein